MLLLAAGIDHLSHGIEHSKRHFQEACLGIVVAVMQDRQHTPVVTVCSLSYTIASPMMITISDTCVTLWQWRLFICCCSSCSQIMQVQTDLKELEHNPDPEKLGALYTKLEQTGRQHKEHKGTILR